MKEKSMIFLPGLSPCPACILEADASSSKYHDDLTGDALHDEYMGFHPSPAHPKMVPYLNRPRCTLTYPFSLLALTILRKYRPGHE